MAAYLVPSIFVPKGRFKYALHDQGLFLDKMMSACKLAQKPMRPGLSYSISKSFVIWYCATQAARFGTQGARIASVSPGSIDTEMGRLEEQKGSAGMLRHAAVKRFGHPEEVAELLAFLASNKAAYLTGIDIPCDGGVTGSVTLRDKLSIARKPLPQRSTRVTTSGTSFRVGGLALAIGLGAILITRRRSPASVDNPVADVPTPHFTFSGQPHGHNSVAVSVLRGVGAVTDFLGIDFGTQIAPLVASDHPPSFTMSGLNVQRNDIAGEPVWVIRSQTPSGKYVVALHGGAYVVQPTINHWSAYGALARRTHATVIVPVYPLASTPQGRAQTVIPAMTDLVSAQIAQHGADNISVYGDSAGGGMALAVAQLLVSRGDATPSHMVLISPWLDVTMSNPAIPTIDDPVLRTASLRKAGQQWAGNLPLTDPFVSPIYGRLAGLPPTAVYCGNLDLLAADVVRLQEQTQFNADSDFTFILRDGAIHDWAMGGALSTPEAHAVQRDIYRQLGLSAPGP
jgi:triacylglycerol lipase